MGGGDRISSVRCDRWIVLASATLIGVGRGMRGTVRRNVEDLGIGAGGPVGEMRRAIHG